MTKQCLVHWRAIIRSVTFLVICLGGTVAASNIWADAYEYDELNRLIRVAYDDGTAETFIYDDAGNIVERRVVRNLSEVEIWSIEPNQGTVGTILTVQGSNLNQRGIQVRIGKKPCRVLETTAEEVKCEVLPGIRTGLYNVVVKLEGAEYPVPGTFEIEAH